MKKIIIASLAALFALPAAVSAEQQTCDVSFVRYGNQYCVVHPRGRRGTPGYIPGKITMEKAKVNVPTFKTKVKKSTPRNTHYRAPLNLNIKRRSAREIRREAYKNYQLNKASGQ